MTSAGLYTVDEVYRFLPEIYRVRDVEHDEVLRELVEVITDQINVIAESLEQMYDDQFVETASDWVLPYIGDLIGYRTLHGEVPEVASPRAEVANTIRYRRRKGTASMLEQLARDVTGWPARAVEFFELLTTTQYMNHLRDHAEATADLGGASRLEIGGDFVSGAFDRLSHTAEVRRISTRSGRYNIPNIGLFLWRLRATRLTRAPLVEADGSGRRYRFDPFGADRPIFALPRTETEISHLAEPRDVPNPLTRRWLSSNLDDYYGPGASILLESQAGTAVTAADGSNIDICDLSDDPANPGSWTHEPQPGGNRIAIDPVLGRIAYSDPAPGETRLGSAHHGLAVEIGGGGYNRADSIGKIDSPSNVVSVSEGQSLIAPLNSVQTGGVVEIEDSWRYPVPPTITVNSSTGDDKITAVRSVNHAMPRLSRKTQVKLAMQPVTTVVFDGLAFQGAPLVVDEVADATVRTVILRHCTLVPGVRRNTDGTPWRSDRASLIILDPSVRVVLDHCIVGPIVAVEDSEVAANDSVIDASGPTRVAFAGRAPVGGGLRAVTSVADRQVGGGLEAGGQLTLQACTVIGKVHATRLDVSNSLLVAERSGPADPWPGPVWAERRQVGCMRFSYIPPGSRTPRQYRCVPRVDVPNGVLPHHTSLRFGDPGYVQLRRSNHEAIRTGADDESEMGVTHEQYQPQRETNLRLRLDEYLRFGLEAGLFYAN